MPFSAVFPNSPSRLAAKYLVAKTLGHTSDVELICTLPSPSTLPLDPERRRAAEQESRRQR